MPFCHNSWFVFPTVTGYNCCMVLFLQITGVKSTEKSLNATLNFGINSALRGLMILVVCYMQVFEPQVY